MKRRHHRNITFPIMLWLLLHSPTRSNEKKQQLTPESLGVQRTSLYCVALCWRKSIHDDYDPLTNLLLILYKNNIIKTIVKALCKRGTRIVCIYALQTFCTHNPHRFRSQSVLKLEKLSEMEHNNNNIG